MRRGYLFGAPGVLVSGLVWLAAALVAILVSGDSAVLAFLVGGALIHPLSGVVEKLLGRSGAHTPGNPLARLAGESTVSLLAGLAIAYGVYTMRPEWFFPAALLVIGGRYFSFQTLYGLRAYWICGGALCTAGFVLVLTRAPVFAGALAGAAIEIIFAVVIFDQARRRDAV